jgi:hypothetical protein
MDFNRFFIQIITMVVLFFFAGCKTKEGLIALSDPARSAESVYATNDAAGNPVVVWIESDSIANRNLMFYAVSLDFGNTFSQKVSVPIPDVVNTHAEGMPKVAFLKNGGVIAAYEKSAPTPENKYAGAIYYLYSNDHGKNWIGPRFLHSDTISGRSRGFFDIATLPDGNVGASWLDVKENDLEKGRTIRFAKTNAEGVFQNEKVIEPFACECCRTELYVDRESNINVAYRSVRKGNLNELIRDMAWVRSTDGGMSFSSPTLISDDRWVMDRCPHTGPTLCSSKSGLQALWYTEGNGNGVYFTTTQQGKFRKREQISHSATHPQVVANENEIFMVYEDLIENKPAVLYQLRSDNGISGGNLVGKDMQGFFPVATTDNDGGYCVAFLGKRGQERRVFVIKPEFSPQKH